MSLCVCDRLEEFFEKCEEILCQGVIADVSYFGGDLSDFFFLAYFGFDFVTLNFVV